MKYAVFSKDGNLSYMVDWDGTNVPSEYIDVTNVTHKFNFRDSEGNLILKEVFDLEDLKKEKITKLNTFIDSKFTSYLAKYPKLEVQSFDKKVEEALKVQKNMNIPLADTPYLTALTGNSTIENRNKLANAVNAKIEENAQLEAFAVLKREEIKACTTKEELEEVKWVK